jgi:hypothetical protein
MGSEDVQNLKPSFGGPVRRGSEFALGQPPAMSAERTLKRLRA